MYVCQGYFSCTRGLPQVSLEDIKVVKLGLVRSVCSKTMALGVYILFKQFNTVGGWSWTNLQRIWRRKFNKCELIAGLYHRCPAGFIKSWWRISACLTPPTSFVFVISYILFSTFKRGKPKFMHSICSTNYKCYNQNLICIFLMCCIFSFML